MKDVATLAGVSLGTVSNVLNSPHLVADATRERVEEAIRTLGWMRNESARQLRAGKSHTIGMVVMDIANPFFADLFTGAEECVHEHGFSVQLGNSANLPEREATQLTLFEQHRVRGLLLAPIGPASAPIERLRRRGIPTVLVDRISTELDCCSVAVDDVEGGRLAVAHLLEMGHRRLAFVGGPSDLQQIRDRRFGAQTAISEIAHADAASLLVVSTPRLDAASGAAAAEDIAAMSDVERPTGVFAANDLLAIGLLQGFVTHGIRVPGDIALIGYDDITFAQSAAVPLSSVRQPREALGRRAAELLFAEIEDAEAVRPHTHVQERFTPELVIRRSTVAQLVS
jgi:LacI family transcriptional regulator